MNRSLAAIAAAAMLAASVPSVGFADETSSASSSASSESSSSVTSSSTSSSSTSSSSSVDASSSSSSTKMKPCDDLKGLMKAQCMAKARIIKKQKKDGVQRRNDDKVLNRVSKCADETDMNKVKCLRKHGIKSMIRKEVKHQLRTIRGKVQDESSSESSED